MRKDLKEVREETIRFMGKSIPGEGSSKHKGLWQDNATLLKKAGGRPV